LKYLAGKISYASSLDIEDYSLLIARVRNAQVININDDIHLIMNFSALEG